jgi:hypothetical protein
MPDMRRTGAVPLHPRLFAPAAQRHSNPTPTHTVSGELHQIQAYSDAMRARIAYLEEALGPSVLDEVGQIKREMKNSHRVLESLQQRAIDEAVAALLEQTTGEAWKVYKGLVALEARLKEVEPGRTDAYVPTGARRLTVAEARPTWFTEASSNPNSGMMPTVLPVDPLDAEHLPDYQVGKEDMGETACSAYMMSGALPAEHYPVHDIGNRTVDLLENNSDDEKSLDGVLNTGHQRNPDVSPNAARSAQRPKGSCMSPIITKTRAEVEQSCREEESVDPPRLLDPDRRREGSMPAYFAAFSIMAGLDDPCYYLPRLVYIKIHEVKRLKEWLEAKDYLRRSGNISRTEKLLHLLFLLQDGVRFETIAVMFSRTPRQIYESCQQVFEGLLQMHSETDLPDRQPACDHLWGISHRYFAESHVVQHAERYYGWWAVDLVRVLVTLNLYIGRYRQQGKVALSGEYFRWWAAFREY